MVGQTLPSCLFRSNSKLYPFENIWTRSATAKTERNPSISNDFWIDETYSLLADSVLGSFRAGHFTTFAHIANRFDIDLRKANLIAFDRELPPLESERHVRSNPLFVCRIIQILKQLQDEMRRIGIEFNRESIPLI